MDKTGLRHDIKRAINANSAENGSNTPDFILAEYLAGCLAAFDKASRAREQWYGIALEIGGPRQLTEAGDGDGPSPSPEQPPSEPPSTSSAR